MKVMKTAPRVVPLSPESVGPNGASSDTTRLPEPTQLADPPGLTALIERYWRDQEPSKTMQRLLAAKQQLFESQQQSRLKRWSFNSMVLAVWLANLWLCRQAWVEERAHPERGLTAHVWFYSCALLGVTTGLAGGVLLERSIQQRVHHHYDAYAFELWLVLLVLKNMLNGFNTRSGLLFSFGMGALFYTLTLIHKGYGTMVHAEQNSVLVKHTPAPQERSFRPQLHPGSMSQKSAHRGSRRRSTLRQPAPLSFEAWVEQYQALVDTSIESKAVLLNTIQQLQRLHRQLVQVEQRLPMRHHRTDVDALLTQSQRLLKQLQQERHRKPLRVLTVQAALQQAQVGWESQQQWETLWQQWRSTWCTPITRRQAYQELTYKPLSVRAVLWMLLSGVLMLLSWEGASRWDINHFEHWPAGLVFIVSALNLGGWLGERLFALSEHGMLDYPDTHAKHRWGRRYQSLYMKAPLVLGFLLNMQSISLLPAGCLLASHRRWMHQRYVFARLSRHQPLENCRRIHRAFFKGLGAMIQYSTLSQRVRAGLATTILLAVPWLLTGNDRRLDKMLLVWLATYSSFPVLYISVRWLNHAVRSSVGWLNLSLSIDVLPLMALVQLGRAGVIAGRVQFYQQQEPLMDYLARTPWFAVITASGLQGLLQATLWAVHHAAHRPDIVGAKFLSVASVIWVSLYWRLVMTLSPTVSLGVGDPFRHLTADEQGVEGMVSHKGCPWRPLYAEWSQHEQVYSLLLIHVGLLLLAGYGWSFWCRTALHQDEVVEGAVRADEECVDRVSEGVTSVRGVVGLVGQVPSGKVSQGKQSVGRGSAAGVFAEAGLDGKGDVDGGQASEAFMGLFGGLFGVGAERALQQGSDDLSATREGVGAGVGVCR